MEPQLAADIAKGDVRFIYAHRLLGRDESRWAAEAAECAADQGYFWAYHGQLMETQKSGFARSRLKKLAQDLPLDQKEFGTCFDGGKHTARIKSETEQAAALGIDSTPTFLMNGSFLTIRQSFDEVVTAVREELKKQ